MAILMKVVLELDGPDDVALGQDAQAERRQLDADARVMAYGGIEGALNAVNQIVQDKGYRLRLVRSDG